MKFAPELLDEIRARLPCSLVVGKRVKLRKAGREWSGLSPFNQERTPSLFVNDAKERWFDFSAGKNGDIFAFVMEMNGMTFVEAVETLAGEAGVSMPRKSYEDAKGETQRRSLMEVIDYALHHFRDNLKRVDENHPAKRFIREREIASEQVERFGLGLAIGDEAQSVKAILASHNISESQGIEAGLLVKRGDDDKSRDFFWNRLTIPIANMQGAVVGFSGRSLVGGGKPKYLNSPEGPIFDKGRLLFNAHRVRRADTVIVVEGYTATVAADRIGIPAVASMGTSLTDHQLQLLWRLSSDPIVCFDGDAAGARAVGRVLEIALPSLMSGRSLRFATLPLGSDPDDMIRQRGGDAFRRVLDSAATFTDTLWRSVTAGRSTNTPEARASIERDLTEKIKVIPDERVRRGYFGDMRDRLRSLHRRTKVVRSNGFSFHSTSPGAVRLAHGISKSSMPLRDAMVVVACARAPGAALEVGEYIATTSPEAGMAVSEMLNLLSAGYDLEAMIPTSAIAGHYQAAVQCLQDAGIKSLESADAASSLLMEFKGA